MILVMPVLVARLSDASGKPQGRLRTGSAIISWVTWYCTAIPADPWAEELLRLVAPAQHTESKSVKPTAPTLAPLMFWPRVTLYSLYMNDHKQVLPRLRYDGAAALAFHKITAPMYWARS